MRRLHTILAVLLLFAQHVLVAQSQPDSDGFEIVRQDERITLFERWTPYPGTSTSARQVKGIFEIAVSLPDAYNTIHSEEKIKAWQENILEYKLIPKNDTSWTVYSRAEIPWPLDDQDYLLRYSLMEKNEKKIVLSFEHCSDATIMPVTKEADRTPTTGKWILEKVSDQKTKVIYVVTSMPVDYPRFITDRLVRNHLMETMNKLIRVAEKK
jgi:hypothetical protein